MKKIFSNFKSLQWVTLILAYSSLFFLGIADNIRGPLFLDLLNEFKVDQVSGALFFSVSSAMAIVGALMAQYLMKHLGEIKTWQLGLSLMVSGLFGIYFSFTFYLVLSSVFFLGLGFGLIGVVQNLMVNQSVPHHDLQKWQSGLHSMYGLASFAAPALVQALHKMDLSWRAPFLIVAISGLGLIFSAFFIKEPSASLVTNELSKSKSEINFEKNDLLKSVKKNATIHFSILVALYVSAEIMISTRLAQYVRVEKGFSFEQGAELVTAYFVLMFFGRSLFIFWRPHLTLRVQLLLSLVSTLIMVLLGLFIHPKLLVLTGITMAPAYPLWMTISGRMFISEQANLMGKIMAISGIGIVTMHSVVGYVSQKFSISLGMFVAPLLFLLCIFGVYIYESHHRRELP